MVTTLARFLPLAALFFVLCFPVGVHAKQKYTFKVASLAPEGSVWVKRFREFSREVEEKSNGEVVFKIYPGGVMGDDRAMYRKLRVGQLHGGGFTMTGLGSVVPDFSVLGLPFLLRSYDEVDLVWKGLTPYFTQAFAEEGLEFISFTEVGFVYTMSTLPIANLSQLKAASCWTPEGDPVSAAFLETLQISPVSLAIPDVLTSLQTGMTNTVFNSFYGSIVLQWFTKAKYVADTPFGYAYGAFLLDRKSFQKLPEAHGELIKSAAARYFKILLDDTRKSNDEARQVLVNNGVTFVRTDPAALPELYRARDETVKRINGDAFSAVIYQETMRLLDEYRGR